MPKVYRGIRIGGHCTVTVTASLAPGAQSYVLPLRLDLFNHSPTGFQWGYAGSGPAQLALALLADATGDGDFALEHHQTLKRRLVARWREDEWLVTSDLVLFFVELTERSREFLFPEEG